MNSETNLPHYTASVSDNDSDSSISDTDITSLRSRSVSQQKKFSNDDLSEYEKSDDDEDLDRSLESNIFNPILNVNIFKKHNCILLGLTEKQKLYLSGTFYIQIIKGGIVYNNIHYNASKEQLLFCHPLSSSIPSVNCSYFAGWENKNFSEKGTRNLVEDNLINFQCILKISNSKIKGLDNVSNLYPDIRYLWKIKDTFMQTFLPNEPTFNFLNELTTPFSKLTISNQWSSAIEKLYLSYKNTDHFMRVLTIGGKNSGKSTFNRILLETFFKEVDSGQDFWYIDLDPGQPEYSTPECLSISEVTKDTFILGDNLAQSNNKHIKELYLGSTSPQDSPMKYMQLIEEILATLEEENFLGTSFVNLPGWIKGFGITILNHVIQCYKPTDIVILDSPSLNTHFHEINIPESFSSDIKDDYKPNIIKIPSNIQRNDDKDMTSNFSKFHASQLRTFKMLAYFHTTEKINQIIDYDFTPLLKMAPLQIPFGNEGIRGIQFLEEFQDIHEEDIKNTLETSIVAIHKPLSLLKNISYRGNFPILDSNFTNLEFVGLGLIHSIDSDNSIFNIYVPQILVSKLLDKQEKNTQWVVTRAKTETPLCEVYPPMMHKSLQESVDIPYISTERRKKHEHIWKVRKNIMRRGHHMK